MIKANGGEIIISGTRLDLVLEFNALLKAMAVHESAITAISISEQGDAIAERFLESEIAKHDEALGMLEALIKSAIASIKEGEF